jgi:hypothetical protein
MRIQVDCRRRKDGTGEPRSFLLGQRRLWIARVIEEQSDALGRGFVVATTDGRRFRLREDRASGDWQLAGALAAATR